jgi:hypothetical protein
MIMMIMLVMMIVMMLMMMTMTMMMMMNNACSTCPLCNFDVLQYCIYDIQKSFMCVSLQTIYIHGERDPC